MVVNNDGNFRNNNNSRVINVVKKRKYEYYLQSDQSTAIGTGGLL